jgi:hypothetical protein
VAFAEDQDTVGEFGSRGEDESFGEAVSTYALLSSNPLSSARPQFA